MTKRKTTLMRVDADFKKLAEDFKEKNEETEVQFTRDVTKLVRTWKDKKMKDDREIRF